MTEVTNLKSFSAAHHVLKSISRLSCGREDVASQVYGWGCHVVYCFVQDSWKGVLTVLDILAMCAELLYNGY